MKRILPFVLIFIFAQNASATFMDNGSYTTDSITGLDWLDLTATLNQSYLDVSAMLGTGGALEGWRYANESDLLQLMSDYCDTPPTLYATDQYVCSYSSSVDLLNLLGVPNPNGNYLTGIIEHPDWGVSLSAIFPNFVDQTLAIVTNLGQWYYIDTDYNTGSYLIRETMPVPETATVLLLFIGLIGLAVSKNYKNVFSRPYSLDYSTAV